MRQVIPNLLWIGNASDARNVHQFLDAGCTAIVSLAFEEPSVVLPRELIYCRIPLMDGEGNSDAALRLAVRTVCHFIHESVPALVACSGGMSRSPGITAAAISTLQGRPMREVLDEVTADAPHDVSPTLWKHLSALDFNA